MKGSKKGSVAQVNPKYRRRWRWIIASLVVVVLVAIGVGVGVWLQNEISHRDSSPSPIAT